MGTDIHAGIEYRKSPDSDWIALVFPNPYAGKWEGEPQLTPRLTLDRDYDMFAILGDVRNGFGFKPKPMSSQRGIPGDASDGVKQALSNQHSATWVTLEDILAYDWRQVIKQEGFVSAAEFERWDRLKERDPEPHEWCKGGNFKILSEKKMREYIKAQEQAGQSLDQSGHPYTKVQWQLSYAESGQQLWTKILPHMLPYGAKYGYENVRLVMDFDS